MATNLRDRGYPSAQTNRTNRSSKHNALMSSETPSTPYAGSQFISSGYVPNGLEKLVTAYNSRAFGNPSAPLLTSVDFPYQNSEDQLTFNEGIAIRNHNGNRLGYVGRDMTPSANRTMYQAVIDNLPFGANDYEKTISTPIGDFGATYDGDNTLALTYEQSPKNYYLQALANLLRR